MSYHGLLDWRLAVSYLKVLLNNNYRAGLDGDFSGIEMRGWMESATRARENFISYFGYTPTTWGELPGFIAEAQRYIIIHPLWDRERSDGILARAISQAGGHIDGFIDTFNLLRRPGTCREELGALR